MPPLPGAYNSSFSTNAGAAGFDVRTNGYASTVEANQTVTPIPWAQTYSVVVQHGGLNPHKRRYRALVYLETDFIQLALRVGQNGTLTTPREGSVLATLDSVARGDAIDQNNFNGLTAVEMNFTILQ